MNNNKEWKASDLYVGMLFTGNEHCFLDRIEIINLNDKTVIVQLTKLLDNNIKTHTWNEEWEVINVLNALTIGEYFIKNNWNNIFPIPYTIKGCFNQIISIMNNKLCGDNKEQLICRFAENKNIPLLVIKLPIDNLYRKDYFIYEPLLDSFIEKTCVKYHMDYIISDCTFIINPKQNNTLLW